MSDDTNPEAEFLIRTRDLIAEGKSAYGPVGSPKQIEKLAEYNARLEFGRRIGEIPAAPPPMSADVVAEQRLAAEWKLGPPTAEISEDQAEHFNNRLDELAAMHPQLLAMREKEVADDMEDRAGARWIGIAGYRPELGRKATGGEIIEALLALAEPVIAAGVEPDDRAKVLRLIRADRSMLETYALKGQRLARYVADRARYGLNP